MQQLGRLVAAKTQIVMLTATLLLSKKNEALTARTNIAYRIVKLGKKAKRQEVEAIVLRAVKQKLRKYKTGKIIVYSNLVPKAYYYYAVSKAGMLEEFIASQQRIIVATSALGTGVDVPNIRVLEYAQESSRAKRNGLLSEAITIVQESNQRAATNAQGEAEQALVRLYIEESSSVQC
ncbi:hypothetical protein BDV95DRAFT_680035 [Massariosphaeria phaeospora]|uniref:Helicase C-terminal domain-containing protein n=1 Tax=Massariosphaeria phaeospora TaxID=100035 RepID=A0A7C8M2P7_9PLEO|nr:hypothetical protein BDV95DRAFT_680035 [Massariosphaeria phaeospora]